jgi:hypothetical protein
VAAKVRVEAKGAVKVAVAKAVGGKARAAEKVVKAAVAKERAVKVAARVGAADTAVGKEKAARGADRSVATSKGAQSLPPRSRATHSMFQA